MGHILGLKKSCLEVIDQIKLTGHIYEIKKLHKGHQFAVATDQGLHFIKTSNNSYLTLTGESYFTDKIVSSVIEYEKDHLAMILKPHRAIAGN